MIFRQLLDFVLSYWDAIVSLSTIPSTVLVVFQAAFDASVIWQWVAIYATDVLFLLSMCVNFFSGYVKRGVVVTKRRDVAVHYLTRTFIPDFISILPMEFLVLGLIGYTQAGLTWAAILRLNRGMRCYRVWYFFRK